MFFPIRTRDDLMTEFRYRLEKEGFTNFDPNSGLMLVNAPIIDFQAEIENRIVQVYDQTQLMLATGSNLETIGSQYGMLRGPATYSRSRFLRFYTYNGGTWGSIRGSLPETIAIPAGTIVTNAGDYTIRYQVVNPVVFGPSDTESFAEVIALGTGSRFRADADTLTIHNETILANLIHCTNPVAVPPGLDYESDQDFRYRISQKVSTLGSPTTSGLGSILRLVPGVRDVKVVTNQRGPGTVTIYLTPKAFPVDPEVITTVETLAYRYVAAGIQINTILPTEIGISIRIAILESELDRVPAIKAYIATMIANLEIGESLSESDIIAAAYLANIDEASVTVFDVEGENSVGVYTRTPPAGAKFVLRSLEVDRL